MIINTWEAVYFDHDLTKLTALADVAAQAGVERFVLDDGWFRHRRDDRTGLGDWYVDETVWPDGLYPLIDHVRGLGMRFGLWVEPEMVNPDSDLARAHPEWIMATGDRLPPESRCQQVLDLGHAGAYTYIFERLDALLTQFDIAYLKWDHNRDLIDAGHSPRGEAGVHAQTLQLYRLLDELRGPAFRRGNRILRLRRLPAVDRYPAAAGDDRNGWSSSGPRGADRRSPDTTSARRSGSPQPAGRATDTWCVRQVPRRAPIRDPILIGLLALAVVTTLWYVLVPAGVAAQVVTYRTMQPLLNVGLAVLSVRAARLPALPRAARRFWYSLGLAGGILAVGNGSHAVFTWLHPTVRAVDMGAFQSVCQVVGTAVPLIMMLTYPLGLHTRRKRVSFWLDAVTVMIGTAVVAWYLSADTVLDSRQLVASLVSCGVSVVTVFAVVKLMISGSRPFTRSAAICGAASVGIEGVTEAVGPLLVHGGHLPLLLAVSLVPAYLSTATPRVQQLRMLTDPGALTSRPRLYSKLPYLAVAVTQAVLVVALVRRGPDGQMWGVMAGVLVITAAVVVRQLTAFTDNSRLLQQVSRQEERFRALVRHASEITFIVDGSGVISYASPATLRVLGVEPAEAVGQAWGWKVHPDDLDALRATVVDLLAHPGASVTYEMRVGHADGGWRWLETVSTNLIGDPSVGGVVCNARDISAARQLQDELRRQASHDPLTGLGNRGLFNERLAAHNRQQTAVILIDLDDFKPVNDKLGHHVGDALLVAVGHRLRSTVRPTDTVVRLGGDEFAVLLPGADGGTGAAVAARVRQSFAEPVLVDGHRLSIKASFGVVEGELDAGGELLRRADEAMYAAKRAGKGAVATR